LGAVLAALALQENSMNNAEVTKAVVKVGGGRGFIIQSGHNRLVVTAAHCLPHLPPCHGANNTDERTYPNLFGPLGSRKPKVWAECVCADPVGDIAVLGSPDGQVLSGEAAAYEALTHETPTFRIGDAPRKGRAWLLSLAMHWHPCVVEHIDGPLWIEEAADGIHGGMSGSPIVTDDGTAIGIVCIGSSIGDAPQTSGGPNPRLLHHLPGWLLQKVTTAP
jgi:hypothetical protein